MGMHFTNTQITHEAKLAMAQLADPVAATFDMLTRHAGADWGEVTAVDATMNRQTLEAARAGQRGPVVGIYTVESSRFMVSGTYNEDGSLLSREIRLMPGVS